MTHTDTIMSHLPAIVKQDGTMQEYVEAHDLEFDELEGDLEDVIDAKMVDTATGDDLDRIGAIFGELGKRRNRDDIEYRAYLKGVVQSFNGRGTVDGLKFAIAAAAGTDTDAISISEDFEDLTYTISVEGVPESFATSSLLDLARLADPSCVQLDETTLIITGDDVIIEESPFTTTTVVGLGGGTLTMDGNSTLG